ncbi:MAG: hypothetical protein ACREUY_00215, partial [Burkholderiales bacterium]
MQISTVRTEAAERSFEFSLSMIVSAIAPLCRPDLEMETPGVTGRYSGIIWRGTLRLSSAENGASPLVPPKPCS